MLNIEVDFSIFDSPTTAYGNVTGVISASEIPGVGSYVEFVGSGGRIVEEGFSGALRVESIMPVASTGATIYGLEDVVVPNSDIAKKLGRRLSDEMNLFVIEYETHV